MNSIETILLNALGPIHLKLDYLVAEVASLKAMQMAANAAFKGKSINFEGLF